MNRKISPEFAVTAILIFAVFLAGIFWCGTGKVNKSLAASTQSIQSDISTIQNTSIDSSVSVPSRDSAETMRPLVLLWGIFLSLIITLPLELVITLIFAFVKKFTKLILLGTAIGNIISVIFLGIIVYQWSWMLFPAEIIAIVFKASLLKLFGWRKISWKWCLIISLVMSAASFIFGPWLWLMYS